MNRGEQLRRMAVIVVGTCFLVGCDIGLDLDLDGGQIDRSLAETYARMSAGVSLAPVTVVDSRLSTYGSERPRASLLAADVPVWVVTLSGSFPVPSCRFTFDSSGSAPRPTPCPTPSPRQRVLIDARDGNVVEVVPGG